MTLKKEITRKILALLRENSQGLSITDIVKFVKINRNTAGRYLENLLVSGQVEMRRFGMSKIYIPSQRIPLSAVLSISSDMVMQLDSSQRIIYANEPFLKFVGTDSKNLVGKNIEFTPVTLIFDQSFAGFIKRLREGIAGKEWSGEIALDKPEIIVFCRIAPTVFEDGRKGISVILEDITERKLAERALLESEAKLRLIADNTPDLILMLNKNLDIVYISHTITLNPNLVCGKSVYDFVPRKFHPAATTCFNYVFETGKPAKYGTEYYFENGKTLYFESTVGPVFQDGKVTALVLNAHDITERKKAEDALRESEERYRQLVDISPDAVLIHREGKIIFINAGGLNLVAARHSDDVIGKNVFDFIQPEFRDSVRNNIKKDLGGEITPPIELRMLRADGTSVIVEGRGVRTVIDGKPAIQVAIRDTTDRKQMEDKLRKSEDLYRTLAETSPDLIFVIGRDDRVEYVNSYASAFFNKPADQIIGSLRSDLFPPDVAWNQKKALDYVFETGIPLRNEGVLTFSGKIHWFDHFLTPLKDADNHVRSVLGISRDITERKLAEQQLRDSEEKYRSFIDRANDGICVIQDNIIKMCNSRSTEFWGDSSEKIVGRLFTDFIHPDALSDVIDRYHRRMAGEELLSLYETILMRKDGSRFYAEINASVIPYEGKPADLVIIRDINDRKKAEDALRGAISEDLELLLSR